MVTIVCYAINKAEGANAKDILETLTEIVSEENRGDVMTVAENLILQGRYEGIQQGLNQGIQQEKEEVVLRMLSKNLDINLISMATDLAEDRILKLKQMQAPIN